MAPYTKKNYSREDYSKLSTNQKNVIRLARFKQLKKSGDASTISEVTSALTSWFANMQEAIFQEVRKTSTDNDNQATSTKRNSTATPTQQWKRRKYGAGNKGEWLGYPLWDGIVKLVAIFLTVYEVICDSIATNVMKLFTGSSEEVLIFSLLTEKTVYIS